MILRMYGLYLGNRYVLFFLLAVLCGQVIVMGYAISTGIRELGTSQYRYIAYIVLGVPLPPGFPGCVLTGRDSWIGTKIFHLSCLILTQPRSWSMGGPIVH